MERENTSLGTGSVKNGGKNITWISVIVPGALIYNYKY